MTEAVVEKDVTSRIIAIRGQKVILDRDLADIYDVETGALNRAVKRNSRRFPEDFCFRLTSSEDDALRCQSGISKGRGGRRYPPYVFTEHGAIMAASVLRSRKAEEMSLFVVRAFVKMRDQLVATKESARRLAEIEKQLVLHDTALIDLYEKIRPLLQPPKYPPKKRIGFNVKEKRSPYRTRRKSGKEVNG